jgi:sugar phosphate permease
MFASTVGASNGVIDTEQGLAGGLVNTSRQIGAAIGAAGLLAVTEGGQKVSGVTTSISGDRHAMLAAALVALTAAFVAWRGVEAPHRGRNALDPCAGAEERETRLELVASGLEG